MQRITTFKLLDIDSYEMFHKKEKSTHRLKKETRKLSLY